MRVLRRLLVLAVVFGAAGAAYWWYVVRVPAEGPVAAAPGGRRRGAPDANTPVPVLTAMAEARDVPIYLDGLGTVQAFNSVSVRAQIDGPLVQIAFREGQDVKAGEVLARIDPRPYQASLDMAQAKKQQDEANLANARLDAARYQKLVAGNFSSGQQADTAKAQVSQLEAQVRGDQAQVDTARTQLSYTTIQAPFDGRTGLRQVDAGNIVRAGDSTPITVLTQLRPISVLFTLPQQALPAVAAAMAEGKPEVLALRGGGAREVVDRGTLAVLDNQVDPATGTIKLKATMPNEGLKLWPGAFVNVRLLVRTERQVVTVPPAAVQRGPRGNYVFVVQLDMGVKRQMVQTAHEDDAVSVIASGISAGDQVVIDGAQRLDDTSKVAVAQPDGNAPDAVPRERSAPGTAQRGSRRNAS